MGSLTKPGGKYSTEAKSERDYRYSYCKRLGFSVCGFLLGGKRRKKTKFSSGGAGPPGGEQSEPQRLLGWAVAHLFSLFLFTKSRGCSAWVQVVSARWRISFLTGGAGSKC